MNSDMAVVGYHKAPTKRKKDVRQQAKRRREEKVECEGNRGWGVGREGSREGEGAKREQDRDVGWRSAWRH